MVLDHGARLYPRARGRRFSRLDDQAAAAGDDKPLGGVPLLYILALQLPERGLPVLGEYPRDCLSGPPLDLVVAVRALEADPVGDAPAHGRLAGSHEADEVEVYFRRIQGDAHELPGKAPT